ncbi:hypothetical protein C672_0702 [[Clostridium] bifermentans ATCC 638]|uniref:Uncharacterized protein n=1 Tax=Paraclostridium bifermentans ATCC 638 = DSM 14991 TaxID=1233171 RepID=T4VKE9_PARBF|nr:hypothetical protein C672_0702 [[Clostridium] bifermentans ATCC 638] [Paraclostridium bifermentans ATCC 638 = DSM 14991]
MKLNKDISTFNFIDICNFNTYKTIMNYIIKLRNLLRV